MKISFVCMGLLLSAAGCGKESGKSSDPLPAKPVLSAAGLMGSTFRSECFLGEGGGYSYQYTYEFGDSSFRRIETHFGEEKCEEPKKLITYAELFTGLEKAIDSELEGWDSFAYNLASLTATTHSVMITSNFNQNKCYDYSDWVMNQPKEVSGLKLKADDKPLASKGSSWVMTVKLNNDMLSIARWVVDRFSADNPMAFKKVK